MTYNNTNPQAITQLSYYDNTQAAIHPSDNTNYNTSLSNRRPPHIRINPEKSAAAVRKHMITREKGWGWCRI